MFASPLQRCWTLCSPRPNWWKWSWESRRCLQPAPFKQLLPSAPFKQSPTSVLAAPKVLLPQTRGLNLTLRLRMAQSGEPVPLICWRSGWPGHIRRRCRTSLAALPPTPQRNEPGPQVNSLQPSHDPAWSNRCHTGGDNCYVVVRIKGVSCHALLDTGSTVTLLHPDLLPEHR
ncbi:hypothetical protein EOD39_21328 [Acipenser ruthenus]|uniref:Uncharacterized protein n=1 Tax=Acipenser ruthenus TaxID=7906 RepID=A0A444USZ4_ACIRT|nr:hypothetical protein EOD39_21328 [Acipenser ruthenus]